MSANRGAVKHMRLLFVSSQSRRQPNAMNDGPVSDEDGLVEADAQSDTRCNEKRISRQRAFYILFHKVGTPE